MKERVKELVLIIGDLVDNDEAHILLEAYEVAAVRILKTSGDIGYNMLSPDNMSEDSEIMIEYSRVQPYLMQLYVDIVLITKHVGVKEFTDMDMSGKMANIKDSFGLKLIVLMQNTVGALLEGLEKENSVLFGAALKLLHAFIFSFLDMYNVPENDFYDDVEEYVYLSLAENSKDYTALSTNKLKLQFKGAKSITISVKIDKRKKEPFIGFRVTVGDSKTKVFKGDTPYIAFLSSTQYINELTSFRDIKFHMDTKTKRYLDRFSMMYAKEDMLSKDMKDGFYPVLVPKGVTSMEGFLDALTK